MAISRKQLRKMIISEIKRLNENPALVAGAQAAGEAMGKAGKEGSTKANKELMKQLGLNAAGTPMTFGQPWSGILVAYGASSTVRKYLNGTVAAADGNVKKALDTAKEEIMEYIEQQASDYATW